MKIEIEQNCLWLREAESPSSLFSNRENWMGQLSKHECLLLIVEPCASFRMPQDVERCREIVAFFQELPVLTILASTAWEQVDLSALLLFDIRLGVSDYILHRETILTVEQQKRYEILCGEHALWRYRSFAENSTEDRLSTRLVRILPETVDFPEAVQAYAADLWKDKTPFQAKAVISCLVQARTGNAQQVLEAESCQFYRLIKAKREAAANGTDETLV